MSIKDACAAGILIGFFAGMVFSQLVWIGSPREFNERNSNNMIMESCIQVLEKHKTPEKE